MGQKETVNTSGLLSTYLQMPSWAGQDGLGDTFQQKTLSFPSYAQLEVPASNSTDAVMAGTLLLTATTSEVPPLAGAILLTGSSYVLAKKMADEITKIYEKVNNTRGFTYELRATTSGPYPNVRGGTVNLNAGDVWKYGETTQGFDRYSQNFLTTNRLQMVPIFYGNVVEIKVQEKIMIYGYYFQNGTLPPGNCIFR